jgi:RNA polymerase sigma-70 factor (ECF subfamily)
MLVEPEMIRQAQAGEESAFNEIVRAYRKRILGSLYRLIGRADEIEDVGQEVFVRLFFSIKQLRAVEVFEPWLYRLTVNAAYDHLRKRRRSPDLLMTELSEEQLLSADAAESGKRLENEQRNEETRQLANTLLSHVSEQDRILLTLKEVQGFSLKELSAVYDVNENALKVRLFRARRRARKAWEKLKRKNAI